MRPRPGITPPPAFLAAAALALALALALAGCRPDCEEAESDARALVASATACKADSDCKLYDFAELSPNSCVGAFQCSVALRSDLQVSLFSTQARAISSRKNDCGECVMASCIALDSVRAVCNTSAGRCETTTISLPP